MNIFSKYIYNPETKRILPNSPLYDPEAFTLKGFRQELQRNPLPMVMMLSGGMQKMPASYNVKPPPGSFTEGMKGIPFNSKTGFRKPQVRNIFKMK